MMFYGVIFAISCHFPLSYSYGVVFWALFVPGKQHFKSGTGESFMYGLSHRLGFLFRFFPFFCLYIIFFLFFESLFLYTFFITLVGFSLLLFPTFFFHL
ncbi:hypothetical protein BZA77DRAFT_157318 [Pyronema omphalodes]|nr:hypothetical protein BZA77DRAFT_157318 [Pyronema omphalodes]